MTRTTCKPGSFLASFVPRGHESASLRRIPTLDFQTTVKTTEYTAAIQFCGRRMLTVSEDGQHFLLLTGDIYQPASADPGRALLDLYERRGMDFIAELNGSFALLLIDRRANLITIATDRLNSYKLLASWDDSTLIISSSLELQPTKNARIDRTAIAAYLATSYIYNDLTPYAPVRVLAGSSIYHLGDGKLTQRRYWRFQYQTPTTASPEALRRDLSDLIVEATRRRVPGKGDIYVTLSGGYDSTTITATLSKLLGVQDVRCFTYALGAPQPESEETVAARTAAFCGYSHQIIPAFDGDLARTLRRNGQLGGGMTRPCDEVDAWVRLGEQIQSDPPPVLFTGDILFFETDWHFSSIKDIYASAYLRDFSTLAWLEPRIGGALYHDLLAATQGEIERAVERAPRPQPGADLIDWRDMIRFEQIDARMTGTWREYYADRFFRSAHPLLDNDILEFILRLPASLRRGKRLYLSTVKSMFPTLFAAPRARVASYATYWDAAFTRQKAEVRALIREQASPLDDMIAPDILLSLLDADRTALMRSQTQLASAYKQVYRLLRRVGLHRSTLGSPSRYTPVISPDEFLKRALTLRSFLAETQNP